MAHLRGLELRTLVLSKVLGYRGFSPRCLRRCCLKEWTFQRFVVYGGPHRRAPRESVHHPQIDDAYEVMNERFPPFGTRSGTRATESDGESMKIRMGFRVLGLLAQLVEQRTFNPTVQGSNP